jgi:hypothetical protein
MGEPPDGPPVVTVPERFDRRLRLGPFPSARDALKFVMYVAAGAVLSPFTSPYVWLAVAAAGFGLSVYRPDGRGVDERVASVILWKLRGVAGERSMSRPPAHPLGQRGLLRIGTGRYVAILRTGGTPVTYLPPAELSRRFELFRDLLRSVDSSLGFSVSSAPMRPAPVTPPPLLDPRRDRVAFTGYAELVGLLCGRRSVRRVYLVLVSETAGADGISDLEVRLSTLTGRLVGLGLRVVRLRGRGLEDAGRRWGWSWEPAAT